MTGHDRRPKRTASAGTDDRRREDAVRTDGGERAAWEVGTGARVITPDRPMRLDGYGVRTERSTGTARDLHAKAVAVADEAGTRAVLVGLDVLGVTDDLRDAVAARCEREYDLPPSALVLNASHTHHGPLLREDEWDVWEMDDEDERRAREYHERLETEIVEAVGEALDERAPAALRYSHGRCGFGMNRRRPTPEGFALESYPDGPVDVDVPVLVAERDGTVEAVVFGYACHPTSLPKGREFHPDWPGVAAAHLEEAYPEATAVFLQGCGADQNPYPRNTVELTEQHGRTMANAVQAAVEARGKPVHGPLATQLEEVTLEFADQPDRDELEARLAEGEDPIADELYARRFLDELDRDGSIRTEFPYPVQSVGFGSDLTLVTLGGEVPVDYANSIRGAIAGDAWVAGYSNDGFVYVPSARLLSEGGYEATWVYVYWDYPAPLRPDNEERITETALALAQRVGARRDLDVDNA